MKESLESETNKSKPIKHMPGFVPVNFRPVGITLLFIGLFISLIEIIGWISTKISLPNSLEYLGIGFILVGLYLIFIPKN